MTKKTESSSSTSKEAYCYKILNTYGFLVSFQGDISQQNLPAPERHETFAQWKRRVLGPDAHDVVVYVPITPNGRTKVETLQEKADISALKSIFKKMRNDLTAKREREVSEERRKTVQRYTTFPRQALEDIRKDPELHLTDSVQQFLDRFIKKKPVDISMEDLFKDLVEHYNEASKRTK